MLRLPAPPESRPTQALRAPRVQSGEQSAAASEVGAQTESGGRMIATILFTILGVHIFYGIVTGLYFYILSRDPKPRSVR